MLSKLHKRARTTPAVRKEIQESTLPERTLAKKHGITRTTVRKWKRRDSVDDLPIMPKTIHATLSHEEERIVVELRTTLLLPLAKQEVDVSPRRVESREGKCCRSSSS